MARNKHPEQTIERILDASTKLFLEKGYDNTSVQDIIDELEGLTKGAIYHHYKSKEDIFDAVASRMGKTNTIYFDKIMKNTCLNGAEKLREIVRFSISSTTTIKIIEIAPNLLDNPKFLSTQLKEIKNVVTPKYIFPIIEEGVQDSSIQTTYPYELAEAITLLLNVWLNPLVFGNETGQFSVAKCEVVNQFLKQYNIVLFDEEMIQLLSSN